MMRRIYLQKLFSANPPHPYYRSTAQTSSPRVRPHQSTSSPFFRSSLHSKLYGSAPPAPFSCHSRIACRAARPQSNSSVLPSEGGSTMTSRFDCLTPMKPAETALRGEG